MKTNEQKNQVIGSKVGICWHGLPGDFRNFLNLGEVPCNSCGGSFDKRLWLFDNGKFRNLNNPDFFTLEGQKVLAKTLNSTEDNYRLYVKFQKWLNTECYTCIDIIEHTNLAELFYDFIESGNVN